MSINSSTEKTTSTPAGFDVKPGKSKTLIRDNQVMTSGATDEPIAMDDCKPGTTLPYGSSAMSAHLKEVDNEQFIHIEQPTQDQKAIECMTAFRQLEETTLANAVFNEHSSLANQNLFVKNSLASCTTKEPTAMHSCKPETAMAYRPSNISAHLKQKGSGTSILIKQPTQDHTATKLMTRFRQSETKGLKKQTANQAAEPSCYQCHPTEEGIKRARLDTIAHFQTNRLKNYASGWPSAETHPDIKVAIVKENFPLDLLDKNEAKLVKDSIARSINAFHSLAYSFSRNGPLLVHTVFHQNGALVLHCVNHFSADWLINTFSRTVMHNFKVLVYDTSFLPQTVIAKLTVRNASLELIPGITENPSNILAGIDADNPCLKLKARTWKIRQSEKGQVDTMLLLEIDREACEVIRQANYSVHVGWNSESLKILYDPFTPEKEKSDFELSFCEKLSTSELLQIPKKKEPWASDEYMTPFRRTDPLLTFDIEGYVEEKAAERSDLDEMITISKSRFEELLQKLTEKDMQLQNAYDRIDKMKEAAKTVLLCNNQACNNQGNSGEVTPVEDIKTCDDDGYYSTYDHFAIHHEMLQDRVRTQAYQEAILQNPEAFQGKLVLDVGCGTAILSMFAAKAGAISVLGVDKSDVIFQAMDIVRENGFLNVIELFKGRVEDVPMTQAKVDIIVSEWMGYFLLFEGMLDSVLYARDNFLNPGGKMFPDRCTISLLAVCDMDKYNEYIEFWDNVYGFQMSAMKKDVIKEANVEIVKPEVICSEPVVVKELDLTSCSSEDADFCSTFELVMNRDCRVTALVGYFDSFFEKDLKHKVVLSTSPRSTLTHWKQTMFLLPYPVQVIEGEIVSCKIVCRKNRRDPRSLVVKINFGKCFNQYYIS